MDGATLLFAGIIIFVLVGILRTIVKRHNEAIILEEKLGRETYNWLVSSSSLKDKNTLLNKTTNENQLETMYYLRALIAYGLANNLKVLHSYFRDRIKRPQFVSPREIKLEVKGTKDINRIIKENNTHSDNNNRNIPKRIRERNITVDIN
jgi:hypothetical protein